MTANAEEQTNQLSIKQLNSLLGNIQSMENEMVGIKRTDLFSLVRDLVESREALERGLML